MNGPYMPFLFFAVGLAIGAVMILAVCGGCGGAATSTSSGLVSLDQEVVEVGPNGSVVSRGGAGAGSNTVLTSEEGGRAVITGGAGTRAVFTDPSTGVSRNAVCYTAVYCFEECPEGEECPPCDECVETGEQCGYGSDYAGYLAAAPPETATYYGECCPPDVCIDGYCRPPEECVDYGELCEYGPQEYYQTAAHYQEPTWFGECCEPYDCVNGYCGREQECVDYGEPCTSDNDCCEGRCMDGRCWYDEECVDYGEACGYVGTQTAVAATTPQYYGECCPPYECIDNICGREEEECNEEGEICGMVIPAATTAYQEPIDYGNCCEGLECVDNVCSEPGGCAEYGQTCVPGQIGCCEGLECVDGICTEECVDYGGTCKTDEECCDGSCIDNRCGYEEEEHFCAPVGSDCGEYADGLECCDGGVCYLGICEEKAQRMCTDTESGPDYYSAGSASGVYDGTYGTWEDYCSDQDHVVDYYCMINNEYLPVRSAEVTCPYGCEGGACLPG